MTSYSSSPKIGYKLANSGVLVVHSTDSANLVTDQTMLQWLQLIWIPLVTNKNINNENHSRTLLVADDYAPHLAQGVQDDLSKRNGCLAIIPSACSPKLQPLMKGVKQKFKVSASRIQNIAIRANF